ncbi:hypothetical protein L3Q82_024642 [Scortum barcoo]|uniref:Uncharacterized protein n=1 Tax=Scortum barcoo TaxID=214431 RepID=A0ACB8WSZ7_9TELE|nr:hypothetical protein L3Q82_024642 [Scortum barcoo]
MAECTSDANPTKVMQNPEADIKDSSEVSAESASVVKVRPTDLGLLRSLSKSDSDLLASPLGEEDGGLAGRSGSVSNCSTGQPSMQRMPSFASEWDEIEKIMNLIGAGIETSKKKQPTPSSVCQELRGESSTFQLPEEEESLLSLLYQVSCVHGPGQVRCDVDAQELDIVDTLNCFPVDEERSVLCPPGPPVVHYDLLGLAGVQNKPGPRLYLGSPSPPAWTLSPPHPAWCCCTRLCLCWPRMMWQCHVSSSECRCYRLNGFSLLKRFPLSADGACGKALDQPVGEWLEHVGLPQYESKFLLNGFDDLRFMGSNVMEDQDLRDIGITDPGHRKKILHAARSLPKVKALGCDGSTSLASWLDGLGLHEYLPNFLSSGYRTLECVKNLWELEIVNITTVVPSWAPEINPRVIKIGPLGHRKRIIASLAERPYEEAPTKSRRLSPIMVRQFHDLLSQTTSPLSQMDPYTSRSMDMLLPLAESDRRRRGVDQDCSVSLRSYTARGRALYCVSSFQDRQSERHKDSRLNLRPPSHSATYATVSAWHHQPEKLILDSCGYEATYLGSMIIRDLRGIESTQDACAKIRKSKDSRKGPVVILSITYRGVKFIDAATKTIVAEHEIRNISCAAQDPDDLCTFAYITKDLKSGHHFCHVFSTVEVTQTYEIILTLGQAFEVAYQMAIQSRARHYVPPSSLGSEVIETKTSRPVSQSWSSMRRSAIDPLEMDADMQSLGSTTWLLDQRDSNRRPGQHQVGTRPPYSEAGSPTAAPSAPPALLTPAFKFPDTKLYTIRANWQLILGHRRFSWSP